MIADKLSEFIFKSKYEDFPTNVIDKAKLCLLDWVGCAIAGYNHPVSQKLVDVAIANKGRQEATIIGHNQKVPALWASFANGAISHAVEMDDGHKWSISHPGVTVIPPALAIGQALSCSGKELLTAIIVGYDISLRVGESVGPEHYEIWHTTSTCGTFGATAACSKLMKLEANQIADGLGNAGSQAAGVWQFIEEGAMTKLLHIAKVGFNGMLSSLIAEKGFTGAHEIFEGEKGFLKAMAKYPRINSLTKDLGKHYKILESNFKVHSSCGHTHSPIDAIIKAKKEYGITPDQIVNINIRTYNTAFQLTGNIDPQNSFEAKFSMPYCVATALTLGKVDGSKFKQDILFDKTIRSVMSKIHMEVDSQLEKAFPNCRPVIVEIETEKENYIIENNYRKGDPENPLTYEEVEDKFVNLVKDIVSQQKIKRIIDLVKSIENIEDISLITKELMQF